MSHFVYFLPEGPAINLDVVSSIQPTFNDDGRLESLMIHYLDGCGALVTEQDALDLWDHIKANGICLGNWEPGSGG